MVHLGTFRVPVHFTPPESSQPGDTMQLAFMGAFLLATVPPDWTPGEALLFQEPPRPGAPVAQAIPQGTARKWTAEQGLGMCMAGVGVLGLFAGSTYVGTAYPGFLGFALGTALALLSGGFWWAFEWYCRREVSFNQLHASLLAAWILFADAAMGAAFVQGAVNGGTSVEGVVVLFLWLAARFFLLGAFVCYLASIARLGPAGETAARSFLPWFVVGASSVPVLWASLGLLVEGAGFPWSSGLIHGVALFLAATIVMAGVAGPRFAARTHPEAVEEQPEGDTGSGPAPPESRDANLALLPGLLASLAVSCLCAVCLIDAAQATPSNGSWGPLVRPALYAVGAVALLAIGPLPGGSFRGALLFRATCYFALSAIIAASLDAFSAERWIMVVLAVLSSCSHTRRRRYADSVERAHSGVANIEGGPPEAIDTWRQVRLGHYFELSGQLVLCSAASMSMEQPTRSATPLVLAFPFCITVAYIVSTPSQNTVQSTILAALIGCIASLVPLRTVVLDWLDPAVNWAYELCLVLEPMALVGVSLIRSPEAWTLDPGQEGSSRWLAILQCLMCLERVAPFALLTFSAVAFGMSWRGSSKWGVAVTVAVLELRSLLSPDLDWRLVPAEAVALVVGIEAAVMVFVALRSGGRLEHHVLWLALLPVPAFLTPLAGNYACLPLAVAAICFAVAQPRWQACAASPLVVLLTVSAPNSCIAHNHQEAVCWPAPVNVTSLGAVAASLAALALAVWAAAWQIDTRASAAAWASALLYACLAGDDSLHGWSRWLMLFQVAAGTLMMVVAKPDWPLAWYGLPGLWAVGMRAWGFQWAMSVAWAAGGVLLTMSCSTALLRGARNIAEASSGEDGRRRAHVERSGLLWLALGALFSCKPEGSVWRLIAVASLLAAGVWQSILGLSVSSADGGWRRLGGMLSICLAIFIGASAANGLLQAVLMILGSLAAIALAVLVASSSLSRRPNIEAEASEILLTAHPVGSTEPL